MENPSYEEQLASQIIDLHDNAHLGLRRIAHRLSAEGHQLGKDKVWRLYHRYKKPEPPPPKIDKELERLRNKEMRARKSVELLKQKNQVRRNIAALAVQKLMEDSDGRRRVFTEKHLLLRFVRRILRVTDPAVWAEFSDHCKTQGIDVADTLLTTVGPPRFFEEQLPFNEELKLDEYFASQLKRYLTHWRYQTEEFRSSSEQTTSQEETGGYLGSDGYWYIPLERDITSGQAASEENE